MSNVVTGHYFYVVARNSKGRTVAAGGPLSASDAHRMADSQSFRALVPEFGTPGVIRTNKHLGEFK